MNTAAMEIREGAFVDWEGFENVLWERFGVNAVTLEKNGARRTLGPLRIVNDICRLIKESPEANDKICERLKWQLLKEAGFKKRYATEECAAGIFRIVMPILLAGAVDGFVSVCGRPFVNADRIYTDAICQKTTTPADRIRLLTSTLQPIGPRDLKDLKCFIAGFAN
jgi:hypothetical protein